MTFDQFHREHVAQAWREWNPPSDLPKWESSAHFIAFVRKMYESQNRVEKMIEPYWTREDARYFNGDTLEVLRSLESDCVDMVFADPPFNVGKKYAGKSGDNRADYYEWCQLWISECFRVLKVTGTFYHMTIDRHLEKLFPIMGKYGKFVNIIKWRNVSAEHSTRQFWNSTQPILMYAKSDKYKFNTYAQVRSKNQMVVSWSSVRAERTKGQMMDYWDDIRPVFAGSIVHPEAILKPGTKQKAHLAQMPIGLPIRAILFSTDKGDTVLDPFNGSGTSGEACIKLNRGYIGIEIEKKYCDIAVERIKRELSQPRLELEPQPNFEQTNLFPEVE